MTAADLSLLFSLNPSRPFSFSRRWIPSGDSFTQSFIRSSNDCSLGSAAAATCLPTRQPRPSGRCRQNRVDVELGGPSTSSCDRITIAPFCPGKLERLARLGVANHRSGLGVQSHVITGDQILDVLAIPVGTVDVIAWLTRFLVAEVGDVKPRLIQFDQRLDWGGARPPVWSSPPAQDRIG